MLTGLNNLIEWSIKNKEWVFSGAGISVIGLIILLIKKIFYINKNYKVQSININYNNNTLEPTLQLKSNEEHDGLNYEMLRLVDRFISIYSNHGILINQIASFINPDFGLKLSDFKDRHSILQILDDKIINWTCETFGVQREWIDGRSNRIYKSVDYYKNITSCIDKLAESKELHNDSFEVYFIKNRKLNPNVFGKNYVILMFRHTIKNLNSSIIYKYTPVCTNWDWGYWRCRYQLKSIIYICEELDIPMNGYDMPLKSIENISGGLIFPEPEINKISITYTWYPEDYIYYSTKSIQAKETEETDFIMKYIEDEGYLKYFHRIQVKRFKLAAENE